MRPLDSVRVRSARRPFACGAVVLEGGVASARCASSDLLYANIPERDLVPRDRVDLQAKVAGGCRRARQSAPGVDIRVVKRADLLPVQAHLVQLALYLDLIIVPFADISRGNLRQGLSVRAVILAIDRTRSV